MQRQAATAKGLERRVRDLGFAQVADPRVARKVKLSLPALLTALVTAMVTKARSLRAVEQRTAQLVRKLGRWLGIAQRVADNTFTAILPGGEVSSTNLPVHPHCLHRAATSGVRQTAGSRTGRRGPGGMADDDCELVLSVISLRHGRVTAMVVGAIAKSYGPPCKRGHHPPSWASVGHGFSWYSEGA